MFILSHWVPSVVKCACCPGVVLGAFTHPLCNSLVYLGIFSASIVPEIISGIVYSIHKECYTSQLALCTNMPVAKQKRVQISIRLGAHIEPVL